MRITIIALSAAALIAAAPTGLAQDVPGKAPGLQHKVSKKHARDVSRSARLRAMQATGSAKGYPNAFGHAPGEPALDRETEMSRKAGGGGGM